MSICIFCHKDSSISKSVEHIIPESLGNKHHFLPKGYVCDACNHYFAVKVEKELLEQSYFVSMRFRNEILTKKGQLVKERMIFPSTLKSCEVVLQTTKNELIALFDKKENEELLELIKTGKAKTMISPYIPIPEYPSTIVSRFLAKCAYEYFLYNMGEDKYDLCVQELLGNECDLLKDLREYARYGKGTYWQYNQRRIYSEGDCVFNQNENIYYEILHEMKLFTKEYKCYPNGNYEAEIYFVMSIAGIEYAICISDPDISGYQKWLEEHNDISPLKDNSETFSFSLSDVNPILIKKDDN
ncbi:HNH endonuclease [Bacteroides acidifaciens]|uniref:HNH endonuclease n=1 Tax=Bacteroides acidifaciens TaxID=85831 RepID=UPI000AD574A8|nr:HNH endonuclease [Bacteroides acidifaciens]MBF0834275.1 hypothetical protein [Bacteroides acidifaciens]MCR1999192.1 HNH endonuclease [Bacteroides acidifaciens]NDO54689.1 HNH endonuclease [Bacteroides acidifaciens]